MDDVCADAKCQTPDVDRKKEQAGNQYDGSVSWGKVAEALLISLLLLAYYLTGPLTAVTAASTVLTAPCTVVTAASTCDMIAVDPLPAAGKIWVHL